MQDSGCKVRDAGPAIQTVATLNLNSEVEARFKEENADGRGCSLTHANEFGQCANIDEEIRMLFSVPVLKQAPMA